MVDIPVWKHVVYLLQGSQVAIFNDYPSAHSCECELIGLLECNQTVVPFQSHLALMFLKHIANDPGIYTRMQAIVLGVLVNLLQNMGILQSEYQKRVPQLVCQVSFHR